VYILKKIASTNWSIWQY